MPFPSEHDHRKASATLAPTPVTNDSDPRPASDSSGRRPSASPLTYRDAGVNIDAQDEALARSKAAVRSTFTEGVLADVGSFGGLFDPARMGCGDSILVASADGVGTKMEVAKRAGRYDGVGRDLVQHCINDILCQGARPLFFLDYVAMGRLSPEIVSDLISGCAAGCRDHGVALLGGETAEMPGLYRDGDFDLAGFIVGAVRRDDVLDGSRVASGQKLIGLASDGLHTNGYSLARKVLFERLGLEVTDTPQELGGVSVGDALLAPHRCYLESLAPLVESRRIAAFAHITGGGLPDNVNRVLERQDAWIDRSAWDVPALFELIVSAGDVPKDDAFRSFNMGVGGVVVVEASDEAEVLAELQRAGETAFPIGELRAGTGVVRFTDEA